MLFRTSFSNDNVGLHLHVLSQLLGMHPSQIKERMPNGLSAKQPYLSTVQKFRCEPCVWPVCSRHAPLTNKSTNRGAPVQMGSIYSAATGWLVIPVFGWRVFAAVAALPSLICCGVCRSECVCCCVCEFDVDKAPVPMKFVLPQSPSQLLHSLPL